MSWLSEATGIHISPKGVKVEPKKILTNVLAATGNPLAIASAVGNTVHSVSPNSTVGKIGASGGLAALGNVFGGGGSPETSGGILDHTGNTIYPSDSGGSSGILAMLGNVFGGGVNASGQPGGSSNILNTILQLGATGSGIYNTVKSNQLRGKAVDTARDAYNADAPLREAGRQKLLSPVTPDLSDVYQNRENPFSTRYRALGR